jgi:phosphoribosylformylglycinamidine synthase
VLPKPGVMDPVAQSAMQAIADLDIRAEAVRTLKKYAVGRLPDDRLALLCSKVVRAAGGRFSGPVPPGHCADSVDG